MNLVSTAMSFLTPMITNRIASALGINNSMVTMAISALVPSILAGLAGKASTPGGASALASALGQQDPGLLGSFAGMLGGAGQNALESNGTAALTSLLGGSSTNALAGAVSKFAGVDQTASSSLIGMLAPVLMGQLAQTQKSSGLDAGGLANLLAGQKENIAAAMPAGFSQLLEGSGLLDSISGNLKSVAAAAPKVELPSAPSMPAMPDMPTFNWMPWALGAAALLGLYWFLGKPAKIPTMPAAEKAAAPVAGAGAVAAADAVNQAKSVITGLTSTLGNIKDVATAQAALPNLNASSLALDGLTKLSGGLAPDAKSALVALIAGAIPQLKSLIDAALKIPGAEAIVKPALDTIMGKLAVLAKP